MNWNTITLPRNKEGLGIRRSRETNVALLGKLVWELLQPSEKVWVQMMRNKYLGGQDNILHHVCPGNASFYWRSITKAAGLLKPGMKWRIGDEATVSLWFNKWLDEGVLRNLIEAILEEVNELSVCDIIRDGHWNLDSLTDINWGNLRTSILQAPLSCYGGIDDQLVWGEETNGIYSAASGYKWLTCNGNIQLNGMG